MHLAPETFFASLAHPLRLRTLLLLHQAHELCVCELMSVLEVSQPMISRHLAQMRQNGLVSDRRQGHWVYYRLNDDLPGWVRTTLAATSEGVANTAPFDADRARLAGLSRPEAACAP